MIAPPPEGRVVEYYVIADSQAVVRTINDIRRRHGNLAQLVVGSTRETTMSGKVVITLFLRLAPVLKVEGEPSIIDEFVRKLAEATAK
jgi:hypothetical protein